MNPTAPTPKKIVDVSFGPSPKANTVYEKNLIAIFDAGSIQAIGTFSRVKSTLLGLDKQEQQIATSRETWETVKSFCEALPEFIAAAEAGTTE